MNMTMDPRGPVAAAGRACFWIVGALGWACAWAQPSEGPDPGEGPAQRVVVQRHYDNAVGSSDAASEGSIRAELLKSRPAQRPGEVLEFVPGVIVTQHSGDGKANQYFLRGFNLDHGTDFATRLNGMPLNMPTHAHGQGYTDLNALMPELVQRIEYRKGPYFARSGDFSLAGGADIQYRTRLDAPFADLTVGQRGFRRAALGASKDSGDGVVVLGAVEAQQHDGPWTVPERLQRLNGVLTLSHLRDGGDGWQASAMAYRARWTATDQVPERLIGQPLANGGVFGRFDSLDPSTGGSTARHSLSWQWQRTDAQGPWRASAYFIGYGLDLYSNFTYALERPETGDQFRQRDQRTVAGGQVSRSWGHAFGPEATARSEVGLQWRHDRLRVGLFDTAQREQLATVRDDTVRQTQVGLYGQTAVVWTPWLRTVTGLRADRLDGRVQGRLNAQGAQADTAPVLNAANSGRASDALVSPKLSLVLGPFADWPRHEFFVNIGRGFHSNDVRGAITTRDPRTLEPVGRVPLLVPGQGSELGWRTEAVRGLQSSLALWQLRTRSELVYVGDAGTTEPSQGARRRGVEFNNRYTPTPWLLLDADFAWTHSRFDNGERIPNAVDRVASVAATLRDLQGWTVGLNLRHLGSGALTEDNRVRGRPSTTANLRVSRALPFLPAGSEWVLDVYNLTNRRVEDIQYVYDSRLPSEPGPVSDRHLHPAEPRSLRLTWRWVF